VQSRFLSRIGETLESRARRQECLGVALIELSAEVDAGDIMMRLLPLLAAGDVVVKESDGRLALLLVGRAPHEYRLVVSRAQSALRRVAEVSIGLRSTLPGMTVPGDAVTLLHQADQALREARRCGGDLMVAWEDLIEQ
jgi:hypothetical protein